MSEVMREYVFEVSQVGGKDLRIAVPALTARQALWKFSQLYGDAIASEFTMRVEEKRGWIGSKIADESADEALDKASQDAAFDLDPKPLRAAIDRAQEKWDREAKEDQVYREKAEWLRQAKLDDVFRSLQQRQALIRLVNREVLAHVKEKELEDGESPKGDELDGLLATAKTRMALARLIRAEDYRYFLNRGVPVLTSIQTLMQAEVRALVKDELRKLKAEDGDV